MLLKSWPRKELANHQQHRPETQDLKIANRGLPLAAHPSILPARQIGTPRQADKAIGTSPAIPGIASGFLAFCNRHLAISPELSEPVLPTSCIVLIQTTTIGDW